MDPRLLQLYEQELRFARDMGGEFAAEFPKIAGRLGLNSFECADPYVERLLEGFALLAARVQLKIEAEFPKFTQNLLDIVYPQFLAPTPSMAVVRFEPDFKSGKFENGYLVPRETRLMSLLGKGDVTACEFRTAHDVTMWPIAVAELEYVQGAAALSAFELGQRLAGRAAIRMRLRSLGDTPFSALSLEQLQFFVRAGSDEASTAILEQVFAHAVGVGVRKRGSRAVEFLPKTALTHAGMKPGEALLPVGPRTFEGYRLLSEYFAMPERFFFFNLGGLNPVLRRIDGDDLDLFIVFNRDSAVAARGFGPDALLLNCAPVVNLFPKRCDPIHITARSHDHHVLPDRTQPLDFEIHTVTAVEGYGAAIKGARTFRPLYATIDSPGEEKGAYYTAARTPRMAPQRRLAGGARRTYLGSEVYLTLVDAEERMGGEGVDQLHVRALCSNRDLPTAIPFVGGKTDFTWEIGAPLTGVKRIVGPTPPRPSRAHGRLTWNVLNHFALNYLSIADSADGKGAAALRALLSIYAHGENDAVARQIAGVEEVAVKPVVRRLPGGGVTAIGRGVEVTVSFAESAFHGSGVFVFGMVLAEFFAKYASINSFAETVVRSTERGDVMRWPIVAGRRILI